MRIRDWSSDVCSSDLVTGGAGTASHTYTDPGRYPVSLNVTDGQDLRKVTQWVNVREDVDPVAAVGEEHVGAFVGQPVTLDGSPSIPADADSDRQSVVTGKSVSVRVDIGGCGIIQKKK